MVTDADAARELAVVLHDLGWLLPRTIGAEAARLEPLPASELEVMRLLARRPGLRVADAARELGMHPNNVTTAVRSLVARGLIDRGADERDGRAARLEPTAEALAARARREERWGDSMLAVFDDLPTECRASLGAALPALHALVDRLAQR